MEEKGRRKRENKRDSLGLIMAVEGFILRHETEKQEGEESNE